MNEGKETVVPGVPARMRGAAQLFEERNAVYGANYLNFGLTMAGLFPNGVVMRDENDLRRFALVVHMMTKITRYCNAFERGGHGDSLEDLAVYAMMTAETDDLSKVEAESAPAKTEPMSVGEALKWLATQPHNAPVVLPRAPRSDVAYSEPKSEGDDGDEWRREHRV